MLTIDCFSVFTSIMDPGLIFILYMKLFKTFSIFWLFKFKLYLNEEEKWLDVELLEDCGFFNGRVNKQVSGVGSSLLSDIFTRWWFW